MAPNPFYCSDQSRAASEMTFGTASVGTLWLLLEYPFAWGYEALDDSLLSEAVKNYLNAFIKAVPHSRLLLIKRERTRLKRMALFIVRCRENQPTVVRLELEDYEQLVRFDLASVTPENLPSGGHVMSDPLHLVCTHGRRDKCCAKFGFPLFKSLSGDAGQSFWQCTHVGGDRFAANLICFPHGLFYAHVTADVGRTIVQEYGEKRVALQNYRGRACYSSSVQAAEYFIRTESGVGGIDSFRHLDHARLDQNRWRVRFLQPTQQILHTVNISRFMSDFENHVTCHAAGIRRMPQFQLDDYAIVQR